MLCHTLVWAEEKEMDMFGLTIYADGNVIISKNYL